MICPNLAQTLASQVHCRAQEPLQGPVAMSIRRDSFAPGRFFARNL